MAPRPARFPWKPLAAACCLALALTWLTGGATSGRSAGAGRMPVAGLSALQLNLCDSGLAACFSGRSVAQAAAVIRTERPAVVTLNEVCRRDVSALERAMGSSRRGVRIVSAFRPAIDASSKEAVRCVNGQQYGVGVLAALPAAAAGSGTYGGVYPVQDRTDPEERVWLCIDLPIGYSACTTHTASNNAGVALAQCRFFLRSAVPMMRARDGNHPVVLGADLNLPAGGAPGPQSCLPRGYQRADDGARQDVIASPGIAVRSRTVIDMQGTTDHPGLFVQLSDPRRPA